jgi:hypothetical protein
MPISLTIHGPVAAPAHGSCGNAMNAYKIFAYPRESICGKPG